MSETKEITVDKVTMFHSPDYLGDIFNEGNIRALVLSDGSVRLMAGSHDVLSNETVEVTHGEPMDPWQCEALAKILLAASLDAKLILPADKGGVR